MKKTVIILSTLALMATSAINAQHLAIYQLWDLGGWNIEKDVGYISLSDLYWIYNIYNEHPDSLLLPDLAEMSKEERPYFRLNAKYRERFFSKIPVSETDSVFIYDYETDAFASLSVKELSLVACLNIYAQGSDDVIFQYEYHIGLEIDKKTLNGFSPYYNNTLVHIGKGNPFVRGGMKPVVWKKIDTADFPAEKAQINPDTVFFCTFERGEAFMYEWEDFRYFIQEWGYFKDYFGTGNFVWQPTGRQLLVVEAKNGELITERVFSSSEGLSLAPLDFEGMEIDEYYFPRQWTGRLFKNKPPVVFYFLYDSFGCLSITVLHPTIRDIYILCDNRH